METKRLVVFSYTVRGLLISLMLWRLVPVSWAVSGHQDNHVFSTPVNAKPPHSDGDGGAALWQSIELFGRSTDADSVVNAPGLVTSPLTSPLTSHGRRVRRESAAFPVVNQRSESSPLQAALPRTADQDVTVSGRQRQSTNGQSSSSSSGISDVLNNIINILGGNVRVLSDSDPPPDRAVPPLPPSNHQRPSGLHHHHQLQHQQAQLSPAQWPQSQRPQSQRPQSQRPAKPSRINNRGPPQFYQQQLPGGGSSGRPLLVPGRLPRPPAAPFVSAVPIPEQLVPQLTPTRRPAAVTAGDGQTRKATTASSVTLPTSSRRPVVLVSDDLAGYTTDSTTTTLRSKSTSRPHVPFIRKTSRSSVSASASSSRVVPTATHTSQTVAESTTQAFAGVGDPTASFMSVLTTKRRKPTSRPSVPLPPRFISTSAPRSTVAPAQTPITSDNAARTETPSDQPPTVEWVEIPSTIGGDTPLSSSLAPVVLGIKQGDGGDDALDSSTMAVTTPPLITPPPTRPTAPVDVRRRPSGVVRRPLSGGTATAIVPPLAIGETFDVTVQAAQGYGGRPSSAHRRTVAPALSTGQPYVIPVDIKHLRQPADIITTPRPSDGFVSIDGRRTYFNLQPTNAVISGSYQTVGAGVAFGGRPGQRQRRPQPSTPPRPVTTPAAPPRRQPTKLPYNSARRRPSPPPIRIDTCIVGEDSTCREEFNERCQTDDGVSSCSCRPGYSRTRPRTACKRVVSLMMSVKIDGIDGRKLVWNPVFRDSSSEAFHQLSWDSKHAIDSAMSMTSLADIYMGNRVSSFYSLGGRLIVNTTVQLADTSQTRRPQIREQLRQQMIRTIRARQNNIGDSSLFVEGPLNPIPGVQDFNECVEARYNDCHERALCDNVFGSFLCTCMSGYDDRFASDVTKAGRQCDSCTDDYCSNHGVCRVQDGLKVCQCHEPYYGPYCSVDGEVLAAALGATAAAAIIIIATFIGLCKWSKRWQKSQHQNKLEMGTLGAGNTFSFVKPSPAAAAAAAAHHNFAFTMDERMRWAHMADAMNQHNIYAPEPMYGVIAPRTPLPIYASQPNLKAGLSEGPPSLNFTAMRPAFAAKAHRSMTPQPLLDRPPLPASRTLRTPVSLAATAGVNELDDDRDERMSRVSHPVPRPRSRGSVVTDTAALTIFKPSATTAGGYEPTICVRNRAPSVRSTEALWPGFIHLPWTAAGAEDDGSLTPAAVAAADRGGFGSMTSAAGVRSNSWRLAF